MSDKDLFETTLTYCRMMTAKTQHELIEQMDKDMKAKGHILALRNCKEFDRLLEKYGYSVDEFTSHKDNFVAVIGEETYRILLTVITWRNLHDMDLFTIRNNQLAQNRAKITETKGEKHGE